MASDQQTNRARRRNMRKIQAIQKDSSVREDARQAVELVAKQALRTALHWQDARIHDRLHASPRSSNKKRRPSVDSSSFVSQSSHERAIHRGSKRGLFEPDDVIHSTSWGGRLSLDGSLDFDTDTAAVTESKMTSLSDKPKKGRRWKPALRFGGKGKANKLSLLTSEITNEAWMCGVCAKSFSSYEAAQKHEDFHIQEIVQDLGWTGNTGDDDNSSEAAEHNDEGRILAQAQARGELNRGNFVTATPTAMEASTPDQRLVAEDKNRHILDPAAPSVSSQQPRPDTLRMSTPALSSRVSFHSYNASALQRKKKPTVALDDPLQHSFNSSFGDGIHDEYGLTTSIMKPSTKLPMSPISENQQRRRHKDRLDSDVFSDEHELLVSHGMKEYVVLADEALGDVCGKAQPLILTHLEKEAEMELYHLTQDKAYYDLLANRALERSYGGTYNQFRTEGKTVLSKVHNKFVDAYQLIKEGKRKGNSTNMDRYTRILKGDADNIHVLENNKNTLYVNVIVKASLQVVTHELQRLAKARWEAAQAKTIINDPQAQRFQQFRALAQDNLVKLAGMAMASDFTPKRIAVQLSNDVFRLLTPRLKKRGVTIKTEIEYRVGPYFVLAVNVGKVDWRRLVRAAHRDVSEMKLRWEREQEEKDENSADAKSQGCIMPFLTICYALTKLTKLEVLSQFLAWCYYFHWVVYTPICFTLYHTFVGELFRRYFLATVSNEIFYYVEEKGMEMDIMIRDASHQAAFMLSALREIRADGREKKKQQEGEELGALLGPLLGPAIKGDNEAAPPKPDGFEMPESLEFVGLELEVPVGFRRLRWALLSTKSTFVTEAVFRTESKYENIEVGPWSKHDEGIGLGTLPEGLKDEDFVGTEKELSYLMPKSVFVKANMCYETAHIDAYNDYCFVLRKKALTPDVPYGSTFVAWTKYIVINTGGESCKLICSVEAEFPNGPPMISRQIKGGMRAGVGELFVKTGETINKYAAEYP